MQHLKQLLAGFFEAGQFAAKRGYDITPEAGRVVIGLI
jgi:hypothetical protein